MDRASVAYVLLNLQLAAKSHSIHYSYFTVRDVRLLCQLTLPCWSIHRFLMKLEPTVLVNACHHRQPVDPPIDTSGLVRDYRQL